jgi:type II secretory pathway pseudopilin PulG
MRQFGNKKRGFTLQNFSQKNLGGFTIIEVIVSIFVLVVGILGAYLVVQFPFYYTSVSASQLTASYLAQEGAEIVRNVRDANLIVDPGNWDSGLVTAKGTDCEAPEFCETAYDSPTLVSRSGSANLLKINGDGFYDYSPLGSSTKFTREIVITPDGTEKLKVSVIVFWYEKGQNRQVEVREDLYKWRKD